MDGVVSRSHARFAFLPLNEGIRKEAFCTDTFFQSTDHGFNATLDRAEALERRVDKEDIA